MAAISPHVPLRTTVDGRRGASRDRSVLNDYHAASHSGIKLAIIAGIALLCLFWGYAVVVAEWKAVVVGVALVACVLILLDFRIGVVLLIILLPVSSSELFPHAIGGVTGLNPFNLLLAGTFGSYLLHALTGRQLASFAPAPLVWLYVVPILIAGAIGVRNVDKIAFFFVVTEQVYFTDAVGYLRDMVIKPLLLVIFALLVGAAVARASKPEKFAVPFIISTWIMGFMVLVYFLLSGTSLGQLARSSAREFLSPLGLHANELARMYTIAYALLLFTWSEAKDQGFKVMLLVTMGVMMIALALTFSRAGFAGFALVSALYLVSRRQMGKLLVGAAFAAVVLFFLPDAIYERMTAGFGQGANAVSAGRINSIWIPLIPDLLKSPIYGTGMGSMLWSDAVRSGSSVLVSHPHNAYLNTVLDMGLVGLVLVCVYFLHVWKGFRALGANSTLIADQRGFYNGAAAGLIAFLTMAAVDGKLTPAPEQAFLWLAIGMMYGERARRAAG